MMNDSWKNEEDIFVLVHVAVNWILQHLLALRLLISEHC